MTADDRLHQMIDAALGELTAVTPAPDFVPRLRDHVERLPPAAPASFRWKLIAPALTVAVVIGVIGIGYRLQREVQKPVAPVSVAENPSGVRPLTKSLRQTPGSDPKQRPRRTVATRRPRLDAEVLVPRDQRDAVSRLFDAAQAGQPEALSMLRTIGSRPAPSGVEGPTAEVVIAPIRIDPVVISALPAPGPLFEK